MRSPLLIPILALLTSCQTASSNSVKALSAHDLITEYHQSKSAARDKYDGREISVRGLAVSDAFPPLNDGDQGSISLEESSENDGGKVVCWFSREQTAEFSHIKVGQRLTIRGVFNGEAGAELKFCRLVKVE